MKMAGEMKINKYRERIRNVEETMAKRGVDCLLMNKAESIRYLTGVDNTCSWLLLTSKGQQLALVLDSDYEHYRKQSFLTDIRPFHTHDPLRDFRNIAKELGLKSGSMAIEKKHLRFSMFEMLEELFGSIINREKNADFVVQEARIIKTLSEIENIKRASELAIIGMQVAEDNVVRVATEDELANLIRQEMLRKGADSDTYIYIGSDDRSSLAHNPPTKKRIDKGPVTIDIHPGYRGYHSDLGRTLFLDGSNSTEKEVYAYFKGEVKRTINKCVAGVLLAEIGRSFYQALELREGFMFLTGPLLHGVGILNCELPTFEHPFENKGYPERIEKNMVLALTNIGLYSRDKGGMRFEDTFIVTEQQPIVLTRQT